jgi:radical SAM protein with 4Fe4S-binding SPASM domain
MVGALLHEAESRATADCAVMARKTAFAEYGKRGYRHCYGTSYISVLNSAGDLATCLPYWDKKEFVFGNIHESSFKEIWNSERRRQICHYLATELDAKSCPPNCRPHAINEFLWEIKNPSVKHLNFV